MGTERETPETDAGFNGDLSVGLQPTVLTWDEARSFARHLERQLAEARELYALDTQCLRAERDEAREERDESRCYNAANVTQLYCIVDIFDNQETIGGESAFHYARRMVGKMQAENQALREALRVRTDGVCGDCGEWLGFPLLHADTCRHYATERKVMQ